MKARIFYSIYNDCLDVFLRDNEDNNIIAELSIDETTKGQIVVPAFSVPLELGQVLMDDLWSAGIRPTEGKGSAGSLKATENHLKDMKSIAFNLLKIEDR